MNEIYNIMKYFKILLIIWSACFAISCTAEQKKESSMHQLRNLVARIEQNASSMSSEDWANESTNYENLLIDIESQSNSMTVEDHKELGRLKARYLRASAAHIIEDASRESIDLLNQMEGFLEEMLGQ